MLKRQYLMGRVCLRRGGRVAHRQPLAGYPTSMRSEAISTETQIAMERMAPAERPWVAWRDSSV